MVTILLREPRSSARRGVSMMLAVFLGLSAIVAYSSSASARKAPAKAPAEPSLSLKSEVNASTIRVGDTFQLDLVLTVRTNAPVEELVLPDLSAFRVVRDHRSQKSAMQIVNGKRTVTLEYRYTYLLTADSPGEKTIGPARARLGRDRAQSAPVTVVVEPGSPPTAKSAPAADDDTSGANLPTDESYFLDVTFDKTRAYVGEQVTLTIRVWAETPIDALPFKLPTLSGFWAEQIEGPSARPTERSLGGKNFYVYVLQKTALFPLQSGPQTIDPLSVTVQASGGLWRRGNQYSLKSRPLTVEVQPLPVEDRPSGFAGNVGHWKVDAALDPPRTTVGQPSTLVVTVRGVGNLKQLTLPELPKEIDGARLFPPTFSETAGIKSGTLVGEKRAEILVQPLKEGRVDFPGLRLVSFNPETGRYEVEETRPFTLLVGGERSDVAAEHAGPRRIQQGLRPVRAGLSRTVDVGAGGSGESGLLAVAGVSSALAIVSQVIARLRRRRRDDVGAKRRARVEARARALAQATSAHDLAGLREVVMEALSERFSDDVRALATDALASTLKERGLEAAAADQVVAFLVDVEAALYMPSATGSRREIAARAASVLKLVEGGAP